MPKHDEERVKYWLFSEYQNQDQILIQRMIAEYEEAHVVMGLNN
jgi:hypothetical protein